MAEFDRVLGGGLVPGSAVLVGGDPGIGKSTLLLQAMAAFARAWGCSAVYVSGEEAAAQVRLRAGRLGVGAAPVALAAETNLRDILTTLEAERPGLVVVDSIQTMWVDHVEAAPGSVTQLRATVHELTSFAKRRGVAVLMVGHVTKEGQIAGPRVVEHMVDTVLYFEGERAHQFRILRSVKNRYGPADEIGVFEMTGRGLAEVANPSALFLGERGAPASGSAVFAGIEGSRPVLVEFQALVAPSSLGTPRRAVIGWDTGRLARWCSPCSKRGRGSASPGSTSISTWPGACASPSPRPTSPPPRRSSPRSRARRCPAIRCSSARSACRARSGRSASRRHASRRPKNWVLPPPTPRLWCAGGTNRA